LIFGIGAAFAFFPIEYVLFGVIAFMLLIWALRPNLQRLRDGKERRHGFRGEKDM
jgi:hypothetical protein